MSITPFLKNSECLDPDTKRVLGLALELVCISLRTGDCDDHVKQAIADKLIVLAKDGERNPEALCAKALEDIWTDHDLEQPRIDTPGPVS